MFRVDRPPLCAYRLPESIRARVVRSGSGTRFSLVPPRHHWRGWVVRALSMTLGFSRSDAIGLTSECHPRPGGRLDTEFQTSV